MIKLAIDFGTSVTKIYKLGSGIVLAEATAVTVQKDTGEIRAFGNEAKRLLGKTAEQTDVCFPVYEGEIVSERLAGALLEYFLRKVVKRGTSVEALFCVPCGYKVESREKVYRVAKAAGIGRVNFAETPFLSVLGQDVPLSESNPVFAIDIGAGVTSVAAFSLDGIGVLARRHHRGAFHERGRQQYGRAHHRPYRRYLLLKDRRIDERKAQKHGGQPHRGR